jgi:hypothetical protein
MLCRWVSRGCHWRLRSLLPRYVESCSSSLRLSPTIHGVPWTAFALRFILEEGVFSQAATWGRAATCGCRRHHHHRKVRLAQLLGLLSCALALRSRHAPLFFGVDNASMLQPFPSWVSSMSRHHGYNTIAVCVSLGHPRGMAFVLHMQNLKGGILMDSYSDLR